MTPHEEDPTTPAGLPGPDGATRPDGDATLPQPGASGPPRELGPYRLLRRLGEGGMGQVWLAEQSEPIRRQVAVKIIKRGMDSREVIARFEAERQALALMDHPCIAKVLDAGTSPEGSPYFVMEYVPGLSIHEYCDRHSLPTRARLELFVRVCQGVQHAHQKAVIHRDLKPGNVLVTEIDGKPVPKIIDFGVAKATAQRLTEQTMFTEVGQLIGTPEYMSPEQAELTNEDVDTRTDVYALGVILYELLSGAPPFDIRSLRAKGFDEIRRVIREEEPTVPSRKLETLGPRATEIAAQRATAVHHLERMLRGDLDWIVLKAMEKERARRYDTANGLAMDIGRYLTDEPVQARPPSASYRIGKLIRRNRGAFRALVAIFVVLLAGVAVSTWGLLRAQRAEKVAAAEATEARRQADIAQAVNDFLNEDLLSAVQPSTKQGEGIDVRMREVLDAASRRIDEAAAPGGRFADKPLVEAAIRRTLMSTYLKSGAFEEALPHAQRELDLRLANQGEGDRGTAWALHALGLTYFRLGKTAEADSLLRRALAFDWTDSDTDRRDRLKMTGTLALVHLDAGRLDEAEAALRGILPQQTELLGRDHENTTSTMTTLANICQRTGRYAECEALNKEVLEIGRRTVGENDPSLLALYNNLGNVIANQGRMREAQDYMARALAAKKVVYGPDAPTTLNSMNNVAEVHGVLGEWEPAEAIHRETLERRARTLGPEHPYTIQSMARVARAQTRAGHRDGAEALVREAVALARKVRGPDHPDTWETLESLGVVLLASGKRADAAEAESIYRALLSGKQGEPQDDYERAIVQAGLAEALMVRGECRESVELLRAAMPKVEMFEDSNARYAERALAVLERWDREQPGAGFDREAAWLRELLATEPER